MNPIYLYHKESETIKEIDINEGLKSLYYLEYRIPTEQELENNKITMTQQEIKDAISKNETFVPMYDAYTFNMYLIQKRNVYERVVNHDYRFPDKLIIEMIEQSMKHNNSKLKHNEKLQKDNVYIRRIRKCRLILEFLGQLNLDLLQSTYLKIFYRYSPDIGNATYTCIRKSFVPHKGHLKPYYTKDEILKLAMNIELIVLPKNTTYVDYKDGLKQEDYDELCRKIQKNDVSGDILVSHQNYIIERNMVGLIQYYTIQGSYFMNQYLRGLTKYDYKNEYLETNIMKMWETVLKAPAFDKDYILYRFVSSDDYLKNIEIGDIYVENGFMSCTRDPFYRNDLYKFGFVLIKIKIPKNIEGVGLCLELFSHFPHEEEIILPPLVHLKLISKNKDCNYFHPDDEFVENVKTRYEFEWIKNGTPKFKLRPNLSEANKTKIIDFLEITTSKIYTLKEKIEALIKTYFDPMYRIKCQIGEKLFYVVGEWYDSTSVYEEMYALKIPDGFCMYSIYDGYILFMIEIGTMNDIQQIRVNYFTKYSKLNKKDIIGDENFIKFLSSIAYYFNIPNVMIYADFMSCDNISIKQLQNGGLKKELKRINKIHTDHKLKPKKTRDVPAIIKKQRFYTTTPDTHDITIIKDPNNIQQHKETPNINLPDTYMGGSYCMDYYEYIKNNTKRYKNTGTLNVELYPVFSYNDLDKMKETKPDKILVKEDRDEIYQIYMKNYLLEINKKDDNIANFYLWMIENKCYLMDIFIKKMDRLYKGQPNPFTQSVYILDAMCFLYNRHYISSYNRYIKINFNEEYRLLTLPKNSYRIIR